VNWTFQCQEGISRKKLPEAGRNGKEELILPSKEMIRNEINPFLQLERIQIATSCLYW